MVSNTLLAHVQSYESFPGYKLQHDKSALTLKEEFSSSLKIYLLVRQACDTCLLENFPFYLLLIGCFPRNRSSRELSQGAKVGSAGWLVADGSSREPTPPFPEFLMLRGDGWIRRKIILEREKQSLIILFSANLVIVYSEFSPVCDKPLEFGSVT